MPIAGASRSKAPCAPTGWCMPTTPSSTGFAKTPASTRSPTWRSSQASSAAHSACPTSTGATAFRSAAWPRSIADEGVLSPGGVGYDINCGVRLMRTDSRAAPSVEATGSPILIAQPWHRAIPSPESAPRAARLQAQSNARRPKRVLTRGRRLGHRSRATGRSADDLRCHGGERLHGRRRRRAAVSDRAHSSAGAQQLGSLGSGNHFVRTRATSMRSTTREQRRGALACRHRNRSRCIIHSGSTRAWATRPVRRLRCGP